MSAVKGCCCWRWLHWHLLPPEILTPAATARRGDAWVRLWHVAASDRLALLWIGLISLSLLLSALLPQVPAAALNDPGELARWLATVRPQLGPAAEALLNLGLLNVSRAPWFHLLLAGAAFSLLVRLYTQAEALLQGRALPEAHVPDSFFAEPQPHRIEQVTAAPEAVVDTLAAALARRGYRVRTEAGAAAHYLVADRPLAPLGPVLLHLGALVILLGAGWNALAGWEQPNVTLPPGQAVSAGSHSPPYTLRLENTSPQGDAQIAILAQGTPVARRTIAPGATWWSGGLGVHTTGQGLSVRLSGTDANGAAVMLLAAPGATPTHTLTLLMTAEQPEPLAFAPAQALALQAEARGNSSVHLRALRGTAAQPVAEDDITDHGDLTIDETRYEVSVAPYVIVDLSYLPGRLALLGGGVLAVLGLVAWALYRPNRLRALAATEGGATVLKLAAETGPLPAFSLKRKT